MTRQSVGRNIQSDAASAAARRVLSAADTRIVEVALAAPTMLWSAPDAATKDWLSPSWSAFTGRSIDELLAGGWLACVHPQDRERCMDIRSASFEAEQPFSMDIRMRRHDGVYRWVVDSGVPHRPGETARGFVGSIMDIHERKGLEESLAERTQSLRLAERRQSRYLARLSHDLRNPLAPIANAASVLQTLERSNPILQRLREIIERQVGRLGASIEELIDVPRAAQGQISLVREPVRVDNLVRAAVAGSEAALTEGGHRVEIDRIDSDLEVKGDAKRLAQALAALITNAARFTPEPGVVRITVRKVAGAVHIAVRDSGLGIEPDFLPQAFDLFAQGDASLGRTGLGLGVGLTLARRVAQLHGGDVEAFSEGKGKGSDFVCWLPLFERAPVAGHEPESMPAAPTCLSESCRVLVVEEDADSLQSLRLQLELWGNDVRTARDAEAAIAAAAQHRPQLVLCDIALPGMDGLQLVRELRTRLAGEPVVFAAVTGYSSGDEKERAIAAGFDSFLVKPLEPNSLARLLRSAVRHIGRGR